MNMLLHVLRNLILKKQRSNFLSSMVHLQSCTLLLISLLYLPLLLLLLLLLHLLCVPLFHLFNQTRQHLLIHFLCRNIRLLRLLRLLLLHHHPPPILLPYRKSGVTVIINGHVVSVALQSKRRLHCHDSPFVCMYADFALIYCHSGNSGQNHPTAAEYWSSAIVEEYLFVPVCAVSCIVPVCECVHVRCRLQTMCPLYLCL